MHDDALKKLWNAQPLEAPPLPGEKDLAAIKRKMKGFDSTIRRRDWREVIACIVCGLWFGTDLSKRLFRGDFLTLRTLGDLVLVGSAVFIAWRLISSKRRLPKPTSDAPVLQQVQLELAKVENQIALLRSVFWWYLLPIFVGVELCDLGSPGPASRKLAYFIFVVLLFGVIYWLNQRAATKSLLPLKEELEGLLDSADFPRPEKLSERKITFMTKIILVGVVTVLLGTVAFVFARDAKNPTVQTNDPIAKELESIRLKHKVPALAVAVVMDGKIVATNAIGFRKWGSPEQVTVDDKFHIGSVTKSMTATVAAMLVEQGKISWKTTIRELFPDAEIDAQYHDVSLEQLLSHRGGVPGRPPRKVWLDAWKATGSPAEQRLQFVKAILAAPPEAKPGTKLIYSNQGYAIAGVMLEKASGKTWEELMRSMIFEPLGMTSAGFGAPASLGNIDQPWGHELSFGSPRPHAPGPRADNPLAISPAGAVHCSIGDLAKYAAFHMAGERGEGKLLKPETFKKLHTPVEDNDDYALGWAALPRKWAKGNALWHNGSNTMFYVVVWIAPERNFAVVVATNDGAQDRAPEACDAAAVQMIHRFLGE